MGLTKLYSVCGAAAWTVDTPSAATRQAVANGRRGDNGITTFSCSANGRCHGKRPGNGGIVRQAEGLCLSVNGRRKNLTAKTGATDYVFSIRDEKRSQHGTQHAV